MTKPKTPRLEDLTPAPYNPRGITDAALAGLGASLEEFGDISGIVWNQRTGNLVCGHQRLRSLRERHDGDLRMSRGTIHTPDGERFAVRVVDWPIEKEKAANIAANNPHIEGDFNQELDELIDELSGDLPELVVDLRIDELLPSLDADMLPDEEPLEGPQIRADRVVELHCTFAEFDEISETLRKWAASGITVNVA